MTYAAGHAEPATRPFCTPPSHWLPKSAPSARDRAGAPHTDANRGSAEGRWCFRNGDAACLGRPGTRPADAVSRARGTGHGGWVGRLVRDDQLRRRIHHGFSGSGRCPGDVSRPRGRHRSGRHADRTGTACARRLSRQRTLPVRQRLPTFGMGLAGLCCRWRTGRRVADDNGVPETRQCIVKLSQCEILDTWYTTGLRGTGSNDLLVKDVFVDGRAHIQLSGQGPDQAPRPVVCVSVHVRGEIVSGGIGDRAPCTWTC